jgi:hypothetical protein
MINHDNLLFDYRLCSVTGFLCLAKRKWCFYRNIRFLAILSLSLKYGFMVMVIQKLSVHFINEEKLKNKSP